MELQNYLMILRERWISALVTFAVMLAAVAGFTLLQTPTYQATNRVFVQTEAGNSVTDLTSGANFAQQQITSYADLATAPLVLAPVIEELGLDASPQELAGRITTTVPPETLILEIAATSEDPAEAAAIANASSESLQQQVAELSSTESSSSTVQLTVISPAVEPTSPSSPDVMRNLALGLVLGLLAGVAVAVVRDLLDNRVRRAEDIERTFDRAVIASVPASKDSAHYPLITSQHPHSLQAESYRELRTNLQFMGIAEDSKSILFTSSLPGEGKSSSAINLAHVLAQSGGRVLLIDADLRRPSLHDYLNLEGSAGLTTVLIGEAEIEDVAQPLETDGLEVLTSGPIPPNPSEMLGSEQMEKLLGRATADYDFVVIDTSPVLAVTDAAVLSRLVGGTVVVAQNEQVKKPQLGASLEKLDAVEARIFGVVLNRVRTGSRNYYAYTYTPGTSATTPSAAAQTPTRIESAVSAPSAERPETVSADSAAMAGDDEGSRRPGTHRAPQSEDSRAPGAVARTWPRKTNADMR